MVVKLSYRLKLCETIGGFSVISNLSFLQLVYSIMKYSELICMLDLLSRFYPRYYSSEVMALADDIIKWFNNELPNDSSALVYLQSMYDSPTSALKAIWKEIQVLADPFIFVN